MLLQGHFSSSPLNTTFLRFFFLNSIQKFSVQSQYTITYSQFLQFATSLHQQTFTYSKSTTETLEKGVKYVQS